MYGRSSEDSEIFFRIILPEWPDILVHTSILTVSGGYVLGYRIKVFPSLFNCNSNVHEPGLSIVA